jgi:hypothetical protein
VRLEGLGKLKNFSLSGTRTGEEKIQENRRFTISSFSLHLPEISRLLLQEIVSDKLRFRKLCPRWMPKNLTDEHKIKKASWHA